MRRFVVYLHRRPNGEIFYVGKGLLRRAYDFAPSRRTDWHKNIVAKYGRENILVDVIECDNEAQAFEIEKAEIAKARSSGCVLCNLTDGGEGCSGRAITEKQAAGLAKGRMHGKRGKKGRRAELEEWKASEAGKAHQVALGEAGKKRLHAEREVVCCCCNQKFTTRSAKAKSCSRLCEQRHRRARDAAAAQR